MYQTQDTGAATQYEQEYQLIMGQIQDVLGIQPKPKANAEAPNEADDGTQEISANLPDNLKELHEDDTNNNPSDGEPP